MKLFLNLAEEKAPSSIRHNYLSFGASLVAQLVKNPPVMWETWVRPLSWEDPEENGKATYFSIVIWRIP